MAWCSRVGLDDLQAVSRIAKRGVTDYAREVARLTDN